MSKNKHLDRNDLFPLVKNITLFHYSIFPIKR